jgi:hypothetical protein
LPPARSLPGATGPVVGLDVIPGVTTAQKLDAINKTDPDVRNYGLTGLGGGPGPFGGPYTNTARNDFVTITFQKGKSPKIEYHLAGIEQIRKARSARGEPEMRRGDPTDPVWRSTQTLREPEPLPPRRHRPK